MEDINLLIKIISDLHKLQDKYGNDFLITMLAVFIKDHNNGAWNKINEEFK